MSDGGLGSRRGWNRSVSLDPHRLNRGPVPQLNIRENPLAEEDERRDSGRPVDRQISEPASARDRVLGTSTMASTASSAKKYVSVCLIVMGPMSNAYHHVFVHRIVATKAANFFCVNEETEDKDYKLWQDRRMRLLSRNCGKLKVSLNSN